VDAWVGVFHDEGWEFKILMGSFKILNRGFKILGYPFKIVVQDTVHDSDSRYYSRYPLKIFVTILNTI